MVGLRFVQTAGSTALDRLGDWNPQLLRELKGRLRVFPIAMAIALSVLVQLVLLVGHWAALPDPVQLNDLDLTTYPQVTFGSAVELPELLYRQVLPEDLPDRVAIKHQGLFVQKVSSQEPVRGDAAAGSVAAAEIQPGDRILAVNGEPIQSLVEEIRKKFEASTGETAWSDSHRWELQRTAEDRLLSTGSRWLSSDLLRLIDTQAGLTLYRPGKGEFSVTLPRVGVLRRVHQYCLRGDDGQYCRLTPDKQQFQIDWALWYRDVFIVLSGLITLALVSFGVFLLSSDLAEEKRRSTLNFLRMSPRSPFTVLSGKVSGVPVCLYLAIACILPLQIYAGLSAGIGPGHILGLEVVIASQTLIFYMMAMLFSLATRSPMLLAVMPWLLTAGVLALQWSFGVAALWAWREHYYPAIPLDWAVLFSPIGGAGYFLNLYNWENFGLERNLSLSIFRINFVEYVLLTVLHAIAWCALLGHALQRRFEHPAKPLIKRSYTYGLTVLFMGIVLALTDTQGRDYDLVIICLFIGIAGVLYGLILTVSMTCDRQTLQDWARYRTAPTDSETRLPLWRDLLVGDASPAIVAIGLNLAIEAILFLGWFGLYYRQFIGSEIGMISLVGGTLLILSSLVFAALMSQIMLLLQRKKNGVWFSVIGCTSCLLFPGLSLLLGIVAADVSHNEQIFAMPPELAMFGLPLSLIATVTGVLALFHWRQLTLVGRSETQQLLCGRQIIKSP